MQENAGTVTKEAGKTKISGRVRALCVTAMLSAVAYIMMFLDFSVPLMPSFIKMDISELPALIGGFALGPAAGVTVCLVKNLLHLLQTQTGGVGELSNFILGACFVLPASLIYARKKTKKTAVIAAISGAVIMAVASVFSNYYIVYPVYTKFMPMEAILEAYRAIRPSAGGLMECLITFNMPFTFVKGMISVIITLLIYKKLSPILKG